MLMDKDRKHTCVHKHTHMHMHTHTRIGPTHMQIIQLGPRTEVPKANSAELTHTLKCLTL